MAIQVSAETRREIISRLKNGDTPKQIREAYNIPHQTIAKIRRESGLLARDQQTNGKKTLSRTRRPSLDDVREHVAKVVEGLEAEKHEHLARIKELDDELTHARKILNSMK